MDKQEKAEQVKKECNFVNAVNCCLYCTHARTYGSYARIVCILHNFNANKFSICDDFKDLFTEEQYLIRSRIVNKYLFEAISYIVSIGFIVYTVVIINNIYNGG